jgi:cell division protein DivIC
VESAKNRKKITQINSEYVQVAQAKQETTNTKRKYLKRRLIALTVIMSLILVPMSLAIYHQNGKLAKQAEEKREIEAQLALLEKQGVLLQQEVIKLNDIEYIAKLARRDLFLSSEGEKVFIIPSTSN